MKNPTTLLFGLFVLCVLITSYPPSATADLVYDTNGNPLRNGGRYYVLPVERGSGGGIVAMATGKETCPRTVVQSLDNSSKGQPIIISSLYRPTFLSEHFPLILQFAPFPVVTLCAGMSVEWNVVESLPEGTAVKIDAHKNVLQGFFEIERVSAANYHYKLVFCPDTCVDVGVSVDANGISRLVLSHNNPLLVKFQNVEKSLEQQNHLLSVTESEMQV